MRVDARANEVERAFASTFFGDGVERADVARADGVRDRRDGAARGARREPPVARAGEREDEGETAREGARRGDDGSEF